MTTDQPRSMQSTIPRPHQRLYRTGAVVLVLLLAAGLRILALDRNSLWRDELETLVQSNRETLAEVFERMVVSVHPPGHNLIIHYLERAFGDSEVILRLPSALAGVLAVALIFKIGQVLFSYREGLFAAGFLAVLATPIYYAQLMRPYSLLLFGALLSMLLWLLVIRTLHEGRVPGLLMSLGYIGAAVFASYTHYFGLFLVACQGIALYLYCLTRPRLMGYALGLFLPVALAFLPWYLAATSYQLGRGPNNLDARGARALPQYFEFLFNESSALALLFALGMFGLAVATIWGHLRARGRAAPRVWPMPPTLFLAVWLLAPVLTAFVITQTWNPIFRDRNLIISLPAAYLLLARAVTALPVRRAATYALGAALVVTFGLNTFFSVGYYSRPQTPEIREAVRYIVRSNPSLEDTLIVGWRTDWYDYYFRREETRDRVDLVIRRDERDVSRVLEVLEADHYDYVWFLNGMRGDPHPRLLRSFGSEFKLIDSKSWLWADVWLYRVPKE